MIGAMRLNGVEGLSLAWSKAPQLTQNEMYAFAEAATHYLLGEVQERTPNVSGVTRDSFERSIPERLQDGALGAVGTMQPHVVPVELGSKPHFPPVEALMDWVKLKLGVADEDARSVAFLIARKISRTGTIGHFMVQRTFDSAMPVVERQFNQAVQNLLGRLGNAN